MKTKLADREISTVEINGLYEVAVKLTTEWLIIGSYDYARAIKEHKALETYSIEKIIFRLRYWRI
ncbi:hypothetical protein [uncultured Clostridium sp.]|uniref:hypothetical protein n=1 Tax=uncultured Clostridium sp. TaxID=59620 RepID=UPI002628ABCA|nr:hypothetical protein [uncultured Clostridium sp.]